MPIPFCCCERCHREYSVEEEASTCEKSHLQVVYVRIKQDSIWQHLFMLEVAFDDGSVKDYIVEHLH